MPTQNYASMYAKQVDERFYKESQAAMAFRNDSYKFTGVKTVTVYSIPVVPMNDYARSGLDRYGSPVDLGTTVQTMTVNRDRAFTFIIDKGDKLQSQMVLDAGRALSRQLREVCVPEYDSYAFKFLANAATARGHYSDTAITKANAYEVFLDAMEMMGNRNVPDKDRVCFATYRFCNFLKQDPAFMQYGDKAHDQVKSGVIGEVDGCRIVKVPNGRLPAGAAFLLVHPNAATAPRQLEEYRIHDNPPGISGWRVEGRFIYDCFLLDNKADGVYYHGGQAGLKALDVQSTPSATSGKSDILVINGDFAGANQYYATAATMGALPAVTAGTAITTSAWTALTANPLTITPTSGHKVVRVVDVDSANKPLAVGATTLHIG